MTLDEIKARCDEFGDCWLWRGAMQGGNVPAIRLSYKIDPKKKVVSVRRWIAQSQGKSVKGLLATVSCKDKRCVCPDHIQLMPRKILNVRIGQSIAKNQTPARRFNAANARVLAGLTKMDMATARAIRGGGKSAKKWADELGCSVSAVHRTIRGDSWKEYASPFAGLMG